RRDRVLQPEVVSARAGDRQRRARAGRGGRSHDLAARPVSEHTQVAVDRRRSTDPAEPRRVAAGPLERAQLRALLPRHPPRDRVSGQRPAIRDLSRRKRLAAIVRALGETEVGRELGLARLANLADFRATVPLMDLASHASRVTARLGFGLDGFDDETLAAAEPERGAVRTAWRLRLGGASSPRRVAVLWAHADDQIVDRIRLDDLRSLSERVELLRVDGVPTDPDRLVADLRRFRPEALVVPSLATCGWLESLV